MFKTILIPGSVLVIEASNPMHWIGMKILLTRLLIALFDDIVDRSPFRLFGAL